MRWLAAFVCVLLLSSLAPAEETLDYEVTDPAHKVVRLDTSDTESFLGIELDTEGRMFVGSRAALFVYEPRPDGTYAARQELLRLPDHSWVSDIVIRGDDLYLLTVSALYVVPEGRIKREGLKAHRLVWGVPMGHVHQCFHGMTLGPEGRLYFATGDTLWYYGDFNRPDHWGHWTMFSKQPGAKWDNKDWVKTPYTGVGAVFTCNPDGSDLQVFARGLRNPCGLTFDHDWNLFTNDNDHESMPSEYVPGRLNHVTPQADFSWPRGWMRVKTPDRADLLDTMNTNLGRFVPVGQSYYDDAFLGDQYRHSLLVARWCTRQITYYPLKRKGATFECEEKVLLSGRDQARPVHVTVGRGGRIFASICYMAQNEGSPVYKSDLVMITRKDDPDTHPFAAFDVTKAAVKDLAKRLEDPSRSVRVAAHQELIRRGPAIAKELDAHSPALVPFLAWGHLNYVWPASGQDSRTIHTSFTRQENPGGEEVIQLAMVRRPVKGDLATPARAMHRTVLFETRDSLVKLHALLSIFEEPLFRNNFTPDELALVVNGAYLRQTAATLIARHKPASFIELLSEEPNPKLRLLATLAAGFKLTRPESIGPVPEGAPLTPWRSDEAYLIQFADEPEKVDLRKMGPIGLFTTAEHWKALKHTDEQEQLFKLLLKRTEDAEEPIRLQAAYFLSLLNDPRSEPRVLVVRTDTARQRLSVAGTSAVGKVWIIGPFPDADKGFDTIHPPETGSLDPSQEYVLGDRKLVWKAVDVGRHVNFKEQFGNCDGTSSYAYFRLQSGTKQAAMLSVGSDDGIKVWQNGQPIFTNDVNRGALPLQDTILIELQPGSNDFLVRVRNVSGETGLYLHYRSLSPVAATLPEKLTSGDLAARLKAAAADGATTKVDPKFLEIDWTTAAGKGNVENGRKLFASAGCAKCHAATADATLNAGPSLADAKKRFTAAYVVESVLLPSKQISPVFKATLIATRDGKTHTGLVVGETGEKLELLLTDATRQSFFKTDVEERKLQELSPMPAGIVKTPEELQDILAYLLSDSPKAP